ncbi:MAG: T9SS type A sorting domain-containing protein [Bacteroidota bacterium]|jgi:Secretion system C-terminal sorting domain/Calcineurin-like phosphoesterase
MKSAFVFIFTVFIQYNIVNAQSYSQILGRPTDSLVTMSFLSDQSLDVYWEMGTFSGSYTKNTATVVALKDTPIEINFTNLLNNTKYFYRLRYRINGTTSPFIADTEYSFHTQRPEGSSFTFAIEADPHLDTNSNPASYSLTLKNMLNKNPDFLIDLGDIFMSEKLPVKSQIEITNRHLLFRPYLNTLCRTAPLFLTIGNHEGELGWMLDGTPNSLPVITTNTRKRYYPNPFPNSFYSGNTKSENYVGLRENYYAWQWGDALFMVIDPYWYTTAKPGWGWTLGVDQYNWFKNTITSSKAKFKFVFCHQLVGGSGVDGRGGTEVADFFEQGGKNADSTYGFDTNRPGWGKSIHTLMIENHAQIYFHGHDHFYDKQDKDGIVYQEVPQPSCRNIVSTSATQYGYLSGVILAGRGFLLVTVSDTTSKVDYVKTYLPNEESASHKNGEVAYSYTVSSVVKSGINEINVKKSFKIFPNPANEFVEISFNNETNVFNEKLEIKIYNLLGETFLAPNSRTLDSIKIDITVLPKGIYFLSVNGVFKKFIKQ